jgi:cytochrome c
MRIWSGAFIVAAAAISSMLAAQATAPSVGKAAFAACAACHATTPNTNRLGPSLHGIVNRKIASTLGFPYSNGLKAKTGKWDARSLDAFLASPRTYAPGTRMNYPGMKDAAKRQALVEYLRTLK